MSDFTHLYGDGYTPYPNRLLGALLPIQGATYLHMRRYKNMDGGSRPSVAKVAAGVGKPQRTVERAIQALVKAEEVRRESRGQNRPCLNNFTEVLDEDDEEKFSKVPNWVLERALSPADLMVYVTLLEVREVDKTLRLEDIATKARISKTTADNAIEELERRRLIKVDRSKFKAKRNRYEILPRKLSDMGSTEVTVHQTASGMGSTEVTALSTEVAEHAVLRWRANKTLLQEDSPEKDSTSPLGGLATAEQGQTLNQSHGDGQELAAVGSDIENSPGFLEFLERKKAENPHGEWDGPSLRRRFALTEYRSLLESEETPVTPVPALDTPAEPAEVSTDGLGLPNGLADARDSHSSRQALKRRHHRDLAERLKNHR